MKSAWVFEVGEKDFDEKVLAKSKETPIVVDFWAPWCGPCRSLAPLLEKHIAGRNGEVLLAKVNIDDEQGLAYRYNVQSIPLVVGFRGGKAVLEFLGLVSEKQLTDFLDRLQPSQAERLAKQALELETNNPAEAERIYRQAIKDDPREEHAILGLTRILIAQDKDGEAAELLGNVFPADELRDEKERLEAILALKREAADCGDEETLRHRLEVDPKNANARYDLGVVLAAQGHYEEGLKLLYAAGELDRKLAAAKVKQAMVQVFHAIGVRSPLADEYRDKLAGILY
ncbi:MAG: tetratricopeptide repeat protein [Gemmataceae bacterium]